MKDRWGAFCSNRVLVDPLGEGMLSGRTFAVKDVFDIKDRVAGAGNPDWKRTHRAADRHAEAVGLLLASGARFIGSTHTDELMFSLNGENYHYGTPINPRAEQHIPGGSSSGSAVAVAARLVDFALGTDTGGSVRIPASYCGVYGFRPTHGAVPMQGVIPLAPSFDTIGWFANDPQVMLEVGTVLLRSGIGSRQDAFNRVWVGDDGFAILEPDVKQEVIPTVRRIVSAVSIASRPVTIAAEGLEEWMRVFRVLQGAEIWKTHRDWIHSANPRFGPGIAERFQWSSTLKDHDTRPEEKARDDIRSRMLDLLGDDGLLILPTAAGTAPLRNTQGEALEEKRRRTLMLCCVSGLAGLPQISLPWATANGLPLGLSLIAGPGQDVRLLHYANKLAAETGQVNHVGA